MNGTQKNVRVKSAGGWYYHYRILESGMVEESFPHFVDIIDPSQIKRFRVLSRADYIIKLQVHKDCGKQVEVMP